MNNSINDSVNNFVLKGNVCYSETTKTIAIIENGYIVCIDGKSKGAFRELPEEYRALPLIDYGDKLIIPGLVDLHIHAPQFAYRGMGMDLELLDWLNQQAFVEEAKYEDLDYARRAYDIFAGHMKHSATTRACIFATRHHEATEILMELMEETGIISYVGKVNMDREAPDCLREESPERSAGATIEWLDKVNGKFHRTKPILTPRFIPSCSDELMGKLCEIRNKYNLPVQSHLSENLDEIRFVQTLCPESKFYGDAYDRFALFGKIYELHQKDNPKDNYENQYSSSDIFPTIMAHCVWSGDEEIELMRKNGVFVAHCPTSNLNLSSGIAPVWKYLDRGLQIGLGSDVAAGHTESIFWVISDAIQVSKMYWRLVDQSAKPVTFPEAFYMATKGGGEFFGSVGSFEDGVEFDAIVLDDACLPHPQELTVLQRLERAVYLSLDEKQGICAKYVAGKQLFETTAYGR